MNAVNDSVVETCTPVKAVASRQVSAVPRELREFPDTTAGSIGREAAVFRLSPGPGRAESSGHGPVR